MFPLESSVLLIQLYVFAIMIPLFAFETDSKAFSNTIHNINSTTRFLIFDVNPGEGFNLRRDVYVRVTNLVKTMNEQGGDWIIVLPPWQHLVHWKSRYVDQEAIQWKVFFDLHNMNTYVPVMEFEDFVLHTGASIDHILYLQRHPDQYTKGWEEIVEFSNICKQQLYHKSEDGNFYGYFWNINGVYAKKHNCVDIQGSCIVLQDFLQKLDAKSVFVPRFELCHHINYGDAEFYKARRSLVFAKHLRQEGDNFRAQFLNSNNDIDRTPYNEDWREQIPEDRSALGGPYLGVHLRRGDFSSYAHKDTVPSIEEVGIEITKMLKKFNLTKVYLSTDGRNEEVKQLQSLIPVKIFQYPRTNNVIKKYKDGGIAIIDQWIVAHARYFIGSCQSTFSLRIYEERDILGFKPETTYNCICGRQSPPDQCDSKGSPWRVKFK